MRLPPFDVFEPRTIKEALAVMADHKGTLKVIAGGTELVGLMKHRLLTPRYVLSMGSISGMTGIEEKKREVVIGAATTLREIAGSTLLANRFGAIVQAASMVAAYAVQTRATVGGNLLQSTRCLFYNQSELHRKGLPACFKAGGNVCNAVKGSRRCFSVYQGDMAPALISFGASVWLKKRDGSRKVHLSDIYTGKGRAHLDIEADELLTHISIPIPQGYYSSWYEKLRQRKALDYPIASAAVFISGKAKGKLDNVRVVLGAAGTAPKIVDGTAEVVKGNGMGEKEIEKISAKAFKIAEAVDNLSLPGSYRRKMIKVVTARALKAALKGLETEGQL
jgi:4-hydroxybenzoyl-CoA reductase subunit beta